MRLNSHQLERMDRGFSLIEVLVALIILGVGMLGLGRLFLVTVQANASSTSRTVAVNLVADLADRIRANRTATTAYQSTSATISTTAPTPACVGGALAFAPICTPAQMAAYDLYQWDSEVRCAGATSCWAATPSWTMVYTANAATAGPNTYTITLNWVEPGTGQGLDYVLNVEI
jgi:type IV pilus assembly protein PilV